MTKPIYDPYFDSCDMDTPAHPDDATLRLDTLLREIPWLKVRDARQECFMADHELVYTYGVGEHAQAYTSIPYHPYIKRVQDRLNDPGTERLWPGNSYNVCFLNRYDDQQNRLGWHADDSPGMLHEHPIAVVSYGAAREIWVRQNGQTGVIPQDQRQLLTDGSLFVMPPGFQRTHQHRIPKADHPVGVRVSLTFRRYVPVE